MVYEVDYAAAETKGCSSRLTIENKIFYVRLLESCTKPPRFFAGDQRGIITKEISPNEFDFWLKTLAGKEEEIEQIKKRLNSGKRYLR
jgi:hypothetical protein